MRRDCRLSIASVRGHWKSRLRIPLLLFIALWVTGTSVVLSAQEKTTPETGPTLAVAILVDTHAHQKNVVEFERKVVNSVADGLEGVVVDSFVLTYADEVETLQDWAPADVGLREASTRIKLDLESAQNHATVLNDALNAGLAKLNSRDDTASKVLIVIGEGNDTRSAATFSQVKKLAQSSHVHCFALLVADHSLVGGRVRHFGFYLYELASATKGKTYDVGTSRKNLEKAIKDMLKKMGK